MGKIPQDKLNWLLGLLPYATAAQEKWPGMRASVCIAQAALETAWGKRPIGGWNLWGLKDLKWNPGKIVVKTKEWDKDLRDFVTVEAEFEDFQTPEEAFGVYGRLVNNSPTYADARSCVDLVSYVRALAKHWATDPQYAEKVLWIIKEAGLA